MLTNTPTGPGHVTAKMATQYATAEENTITARLLHAHRELYQRAWRGLDYTPTQYFVDRGKGGAKALAILNVLSTAINLIKPGSIPPSQIGVPTGITTTINEDGTVTIG